MAASGALRSRHRTQQGGWSPRSRPPYAASPPLPAVPIGLAGRHDGRVAGAERVAQAGGADPAGDGLLAADEDRAEEQEDEPGWGAPVEDGREAGGPLAGAGVGV